MSISSLPKYAKAKQAVLGYIGKREVEVGGKLPSEKELAKQFDVSIITVRRALHELASEGVVDRVQGKGTFVMSYMSKARKIGDITFLGIDSWTYPSSSQLKELSEELHNRGHGLKYLICRLTPDNMIYEEIIKTKGVIFSGYVTDEWISFLKNSGVPAILIGSYPVTQKICTVQYNWIRATELLVNHYISKGLTKIGLITSDPDFFPSHVIVAGFKSAFKKLNLACPEENIMWAVDELRHQKIAEFVSQHKNSFDAIIVQEGNFLPLLTYFWETPKERQPYLGVLGDDTFIPPQYSKVICTYFKRTALMESVDLLFDLLNGKNFHEQEILIEPYLSIDNTNSINIAVSKIEKKSEPKTETKTADIDGVNSKEKNFKNHTIIGNIYEGLAKRYIQE